MPSLIDIRRRVRAVKTTQQITKAMKMVSASKLRRAQERIVNARPYAQKMLSVLNSLAARVDPSAHPLLAERPASDGRTLLIVITADKGLCGSFNTNVVKAATSFANETPARQVAMGLVGRKGRDFFRRRGFDVRYEDVGLFSALKLSHAQAVAARAIEEFTAGRVSSVYLVYNEFKSVMTQRVARRAAAPDRAARRSGRGREPRRRPRRGLPVRAVAGGDHQRAPAEARGEPDLPRPPRIGGVGACGAHDRDGLGDAQRERHDRQA